MNRRREQRLESRAWDCTKAHRIPRRLYAWLCLNCHQQSSQHCNERMNFDWSLSAVPFACFLKMPITISAVPYFFRQIVNVISCVRGQRSKALYPILPKRWIRKPRPLDQRCNRKARWPRSSRPYTSCAYNGTSSCAVPILVGSLCLTWLAIADPVSRLVSRISSGAAHA